MNGMIPASAPLQPAASPISPPAATSAPTPNQDPQVKVSQQTLNNDLHQYIAKGLQIISSPDTRDSIVTILKNGDPVSALANALVIVVQKLDMASRKKGVEVADFVKLLGATELLKALTNVMKNAGIADLDKKHQALAMALAMQNYQRAEIAAGRTNPAKLEQQQNLMRSKLSPKMLKNVETGARVVQETALQYKGGR